MITQCGNRGESVRPLTIRDLGQAVGFLLFFIVLAGAVCGLLFATGHSDLGTRNGQNDETVVTGPGGLSGLPGRLQR